jgi:hypothetical protein
MTDERRINSLDELLVRIGAVEKGLLTLETEKYQRQQEVINHRSETLSMLEKTEKRLEAMIKEVVGGIKNDVFMPLLIEVKSIKDELSNHRKLIWMGLGFVGAFALILEVYRVIK